MSEATKQHVRRLCSYRGLPLNETPPRTLWERSPLTDNEWEAIAIWLDVEETGANGGPAPVGVRMVDALDAER